MRWLQLAFTEDDPGNFDPEFWLEYFREIHADGLCLSAGETSPSIRRVLRSTAVRAGGIAIPSVRWSRVQETRHEHPRAHRSHA